MKARLWIYGLIALAGCSETGNGTVSSEGWDTQLRIAPGNTSDGVTFKVSNLPARLTLEDPGADPIRFSISRKGTILPDIVELGGKASTTSEIRELGEYTVWGFARPDAVILLQSRQKTTE